jgi:L-threonylcarbamoyladenylate synthase
MLRLPFTAPEHLDVAVAAVRDTLANHGVLALPTETFYGLAVAPDDPVAVRRLYALKGRPEAKALPVIGASLAQLEPLVIVPEGWGGRLGAAWPAAFTAILEARMALAAAGRTVAVRVPDHVLLRALLASVGPLTATSANRSGSGPLTRADEVADALGAGLSLLLDGGETPGDVPSTLVDLTSGQPRLVRRGRWQPPFEWDVKEA